MTTQNFMPITAPSIQSTLLQAARIKRAIQDLETKERCENSLLDFIDYVWPVVEPARQLVHGWALEAICEHLEAVTFGGIKRLVINVPPGFSKSLCANVFWPAWEWGPRKMPSMRYVCASYAQHLTERDNMRCRNVVVNERYQKYWSDIFKISNEQFTKVKFANDHTGWKFATSVSGIGQGERGDRFVIDDPNNPVDAESAVVRDSVNQWFTEVVPDRLNDMENSAIVVIQQRVHANDVTGIILEKEFDYVHLVVPMEYEVGRHCVTVLGIDEDDKEVLWSDPRSQEGELAWDKRFSRKIVENLKKEKGSFAWSGQYQQSPAPRGGGIIKHDWWQLWGNPDDPNDKNYREFPPFEFILGSLDCAFGEKQENDFSAMTVWGVWRDEYNMAKIMLIKAWHDRMPLHELVDRVQFTANRCKVDTVLVEAKGPGISVMQELRRLYSGERFGVMPVDPSRQGDKVARMHSISHLFEEGLIYAPNKDYAKLVISEMDVFPKGAHDDLCDSTSQALRYMRQVGLLMRTSEQSLEDGDLFVYSGKQAPLYPI